MQEIDLPDDLPLLPEGWSYYPLGLLVDEKRGISYGIVQPGNHEFQGIPIIRAGDVENGRINPSEILKVNPEIERKYQRTRLRGGEVILTLVGAYFGKAAVVSAEYAGWNVARAVAVIPVLEEISSKWIELCLRSELLHQYMLKWATTTAQPTLNLGDVARLPIPLPPTEERRAISQLLGSLDDKIELNRRMNATLEETARALFQSWFVDFDPVRAKMEVGSPTAWTQKPPPSSLIGWSRASWVSCRKGGK